MSASLGGRTETIQELVRSYETVSGVLADNDQRWTVVTFHHPVWSGAEGRNNPALREIWGPILEEHGVDLVLQGHDHTYGRGNVPTGTTTATTGGAP